MRTVDVVVIGAGFGGLRAVYEMRQLGLSVLALEAADDVGGTWYWNRYPGARTDSEAWNYCYFFSREIWEEWTWKERMPSQDEVFAYLRFVADRLDLRKDIQFNARVLSTHFRENDRKWIVTTDDGEVVECTYLISASGILSAAYEPPFVGLSTFTGEWYLTARWPKHDVDFENKRVAIIGSGSTAVQVLPLVAQVAKQVMLFQRTPNYVLPGRNYALSAIEQRAYKMNFEEIQKKIQSHVFAFSMNDASRAIAQTSAEEVEKVLDFGWEIGSFRFVFELFNDIMLDERANKVVSDFIRRKIQSIVKDAHTAELLCPDYPFMAKRPPLGNFYYEAFNRDNVSVVDISSEPISAITPTGVKVGEQVYDADIIVFALGFDAGTGALSQIDMRGANEQSLRSKWFEGPRTYLGVMTDEFPNFFMVSGPQSPFSNIPPIIEHSVTWIGRVISENERRGRGLVETSPDDVEAWGELMAAYIDATILRKGGEVGSWFLGANIPDKPCSPLFHFGGANTYFDQLERSFSEGFEGLRFRASDGDEHPRPTMASLGSTAESRAP